MREIKFRAYHEYMKKMLIPIKLHLNNGKITCFETLLDDNVYQVKIDDREYGLNMMQYTGLKDKNGKEIYEGDLIKYDGNSRVWEVYFDKDSLQYRIRCTEKDGFVASYPMKGLDLFVVGNIYEIPDLINN